MVHTWSIRRTKDEEDVRSLYDGYPTLFSLRLHHGGKFSGVPGREYVNGTHSYVDLVDTDEFSLHELDAMMGEIGFDTHRRMYYHCKKPDSDLDVGLFASWSDKDVCLLTAYVPKHRLLEVYVEVEDEVSQLECLTVEPIPPRAEFSNVEDDGYGFEVSEEECEDFDDDVFSVEEEDLLVDVEVDMNEFMSNTDKDLEWLEPSQNVHEIADMDNTEVEMMDNEDFDSVSEGEEGVDRLRKKKLRDLRKKNRLFELAGCCNGPNFQVGQTFFSAKEVKDSIRKYSIMERREISFVKNDKNRVKAVCDGTTPTLSTCVVGGPSNIKELKGKEVISTKRTCPWVIYVSRWKEEEEWVVKTFIDNHTCLQSRKIKACTTTYLSNQIVDQIDGNPNIPTKALQDELEKKYQVGVSRMKVFRAKTKAKSLVMGDYKHQYSILRDYVCELQARNEDTTVKIDVYPETGSPNIETRVFRRIYVCLGSLKKGFKAGKRDLLGLDGAFMKGPYPGQVLTAVGVDSNNGIYPLAYAIFEAETLRYWTWFLTCLGDDLELGRNSNFTFITDRQKGVIPAIANLYPCVEHRYCVRHIYENMKVNWKAKEFKEILWKAARATSVPHFNAVMEELKKLNKDAFEWLKNIPPQHWSRSHFTGRAKCDVLLNNMCESLNSQMEQARDKPIITVLEFIREYLMKRIVLVQKEIDKSKGPLTPYGTKIMDENKKEAVKYQVTFNGGQKYHVSGQGHDQYVVDIQERYCTCRKWEVTGMPCKHAVATIWDLGKHGVGDGRPENWTHPVYWLETWKAMYEFKIDPINGRSMWPKSQCPTVLLPPHHHTPIGRPKKKRRKGVDEGVVDGQDMVKDGKLSRQGKSIQCAKCGNKGHNSRTCKGQPGGSASASASASGGASASSGVKKTRANAGAGVKRSGAGAGVKRNRAGTGAGGNKTGGSASAKKKPPNVSAKKKPASEEGSSWAMF